MQERQGRAAFGSEFLGDATAITVFEKDEKAPDIYMNLYNDGSEREALIMHAGGFKMPRSEGRQPNWLTLAMVP